MDKEDIEDIEPVSRVELAKHVGIEDPNPEDWNNSDNAILGRLLLRVEKSIESLEESLSEKIDEKIGGEE